MIRIVDYKAQPEEVNERILLYHSDIKLARIWVSGIKNSL